ncbi:hypothetical protein H8D04_01590 [bacterium]|nr:hypothetical protein [bacterium]
MGKNKDVWKLYDDEYRVHSDKKRKVNKIVKETKGHIVCEYSKRGKVFAWDISVPTSRIKIARKILKEK